MSYTIVNTASGIDVNTEGSYRLHLDFILEMVLSGGGYQYHFQENERSITLTISTDKNVQVYKHECNFLDKRRSIESFLMNVVEIGLKK